MAKKVLEFKRPEPKGDEPFWVTGPAICLRCRHKWEALSEATMRSLECPECGLSTGVPRGVIVPSQDEEMWTCNCSNDTFWVLRDGIMCLVCGERMDFPI